jgi:hypothetical protein
MTGLQETFYIVALIYMGISLLLIIALVVTIAVIRSKVVSMERNIKEKLELITSLPSTVESIINGIRGITKPHK